LNYARLDAGKLNFLLAAKGVQHFSAALLRLHLNIRVIT